MEKPWTAPIRRLLAARGWTQGDLAEKAGLRPTTLSEALNGRSPRMETLERVAAAFDVPLFELFVSSEQSALLRQVAHHHAQLTRQEDLAARVIEQLAPHITLAVAAAVSGTSTPQQASYSAAEHGPPGEILPRGKLPHRRA